MLIFQRNEQQIDSGTHAACLPQKMRPIGSKTKQKIRNEFQAGQFKSKGKNHGQTFKLRPSLFKRQDTGQALILLKVPLSLQKKIILRKDYQTECSNLGTSDISIIQQKNTFPVNLPPNSSDSMISDRQTYETFFGKFESQRTQNSHSLRNKKECNQKLKNIEHDYSKISSYYDEMSNIVMNQNQSILKTDQILGGAVSNMQVATSELKESEAIRQSATKNAIRTLVMIFMCIFVLGFIYLL